MNELLAVLMRLQMIILSALLLILYKGYVLSRLWHWFVTPFGVEDIGVARAIGVAVITTLLTARLPDDNKEKDKGQKNEIVSFVSMVVFISFVWFEGYIVHFFL